MPMSHTVHHLLRQLQAKSRKYEDEQFEKFESFVASTCQMESAVRFSLSKYTSQFGDEADNRFLQQDTCNQTLLFNFPCMLHVLCRHAVAILIVTQLKHKLSALAFTQNIALSEQFIHAENVRHQGALMREYIQNSTALDFAVCDRIRIRVTHLANNPVMYPILSLCDLDRCSLVLGPVLQPATTRISELTSESDNAWDLTDFHVRLCEDFACVTARQLENVVDVVENMVQSCELQSSPARRYYNCWSTLSTVRMLKPYFCSHTRTADITSQVQEVLEQTQKRRSRFHRIPLEIVLQRILLPIVQDTVDDTYDLPAEYMDMVNDVDEQCGPFDALMKSITQNNQD